MKKILLSTVNIVSLAYAVLGISLFYLSLSTFLVSNQIMFFIMYFMLIITFIWTNLKYIHKRRFRVLILIILYVIYSFIVAMLILLLTPPINSTEFGQLMLLLILYIFNFATFFVSVILSLVISFFTRGKKIVIEDYNENWKTEFEKAQKFYEELLVGLEIEIVHVGSTSIEGLAAKPILDIDIIVNDEETSEKVISKLESVAYTHIGDAGISGREVLKYNENNEHITWIDHHLYVCLRSSENVENHLLLKRHLENNREAIEEYNQLKKKLAKKYPYDIDSYIDGKTELITSFLEAEGMNNESLSRITDINKN